MKRIGRFDDFLVRLNETGEHVIMQADFESLLHKGIARPGALAVYGGVIPDSVTPSTYTHYMCPYEVIILFNDMKQKYNLDTAKMVVEGDEKRGKRETWVEITEDHPLYDQAKDHIDFDL